MAHYAKIENNIVTQVIVADSNFVSKLPGKWLRTSYNTRGNVHLRGNMPLRKNYAGVGYTYDENLDAFVPPKPHEEWLLNTETCLWEAPEGWENTNE